MPIPLLILQIVIQIVTLLAVIFLLLRKAPAPQQDPRFTQLPDQLTRLDARNQAADEHMRNAFAQMRTDIAAEASASRETSASAAVALRTEITTSIATLGQTLQNGLGSFREDNKSAATALTQSVHQQLEALSQRLTAFTNETTQQHTSLRESLNTKLADLTISNTALQDNLRGEITRSITALGQTLQTGLTNFRDDNKTSDGALRQAVQQQFDAIAQRLTAFTSESTQQQTTLRESINSKLNDLMASNTGHQNQLRSTVEDRLNQLNAANTAKLEEMRVTVDEKLHSTLQTRLTESFGQVTTHLGEVQKGLGEMKELANGVGDLKKVLSNVGRRGGVGEFMVGQQLEQMFSPEQYIKQANIKLNTKEKVDFALKFPNGENGGFILLPIDAKFPTSDWERLEHAYDHGTASEIAIAGKAFEAAIRSEAKSIGDKYIDPPTTMPHAIMVLPAESLYAEVVRRPGLQSEIQSTCHVTIAGPSTFMAILTSFQMGFQSLKLEKKGHEIRNVLEQAKSEFGNFGVLMTKMETQVGTVQNTIQKLGVRTRAINRTLREVGEVDSSASNLIAFEEAPDVAPLLAANSDED